MKNVKIKYLIIGIVCGFVAAALVLCALYYCTVGDIDWRVYIEETLLPNAVTALTTMGIIGVGVKPTLTKIIEAASGFMSSAKIMHESAEQNASSQEDVAESRKSFTEQTAAIKEAVEALTKENSAKLSEYDTQLKDIKKMISLGFGTMDELVKKGSAARIMRVGEKRNVGKDQN